MNDILLLTDFSELSGYARSLADKIAFHSGAKLQVLKIVDVPSDIEISKSGDTLEGLGNDTSSLIREKEESESKMIEWVSNLKSKNSTSVIYGRLLQSVNETIKKLDASLVIMGTHGVSGMEELLSGSIVEHIILKNKVPVLSLKSDRESLDFSDFLITGDFEEAAQMNLDMLKVLQRVFNSKVHLLWVNTNSRFLTSSEATERMKKFAQINQLENTHYHIYNDKSIEEGIINFSNNYDASHELDIDIIAIEKKNKSQLGYVLTGCQATSFVNHIFRPLITYSKV